MRITQEKLKEILASHGKWLRCENGGERTDLRNADLSNMAKLAKMEEEQ